MIRKLTFAVSILLSMSMSAQMTGVVIVDEPAKGETAKDSIEGFKFTTIDSVAITPVKDQNRSSTCWAFSTIGFLESELLRTGKGEHDLSEMFVVSKTMMDRATYFVRQYGEGSSFAPGGSAYDVIYRLSH